MAKVTVDASACVGCGLCEQSCPEVFEVGGDGIARVKQQSCALHNLKEVAEQCPVNSIKITD
ncbi:MAG: ferredoxin [Candidatus Omnitrophota bacterium]|nr:MAG: ferredoxin [Candidatus Omnitrophota bacterium]